MAIAPGLRIGRYDVLTKLGQGGFGIIYVGRDTELDRDVALKFLRPEHVTRPDVVMRFLQEARSAAKINHPGIVTVFECGQVTNTNTRAEWTERCRFASQTASAPAAMQPTSVAANQTELK